MKIKLLYSISLFVCLFGLGMTSAQSIVSYQLPATFNFDYEVMQRGSGNKNPTDSCTLHFLYSKSGDYAATRFSRKSNMKGSLLMIITRDGMVILFDDRKKDITIVSIRKLISDLTSLTKYIRIDSLMANMRKNRDSKDIEFVKTGKSKPVGIYTTEEYRFTDSRHQHGSVWLAKVDFNGPADYVSGALGANVQQMMNRMSGSTTSLPIMQALMQSKTLVTDFQSTDSTGAKNMNMHTVSIETVSTTVSTSGYQVNNYSNLTIPEIFEAEMKKRND
jgi:hypothetical protein